ncbi:MAG TPA: sulfatase-like hydrolase/transferase [Puia sp.]|nr:sulfatase-like hydrolase/transferase [Puia sp.]
MKRLRAIPFFVFLLPVFFVLHGYRENLGYIHPGEAILLAAVYLLGAAVVFGLAFLLYRDATKAALAAAFLLGLYFFFGAIQDFLKAHFHPMSRYSVLVPILLIGAAAWLIFLRRTRAPFPQWFLYLNSLFLLYILVDAATIGFYSAARDRPPINPFNTPVNFFLYTGAAKPDIYFLLFDAYASSKCLQEQYHYDNSDFDRFLNKKGFHIQSASRANYKYTILSMPSIFNMGYLDKLKDVKGGPVTEYYYLSDLIRDNDLMNWLHSIGYDIVNCSIFDLRGHPSPITESLLPLQTRLITDQTFYSRFYRDIGWNFYQFTVNPFSEREIDLSLNNDNKLIARLEAASAVPSPHPRFFYGHFNMPHPPYYFDSQGNRLKVRAPYKATDEDSVQDYLGYLSYTNQKAEEMISAILTNTRGQAVIIFMGDHGLRYHDRLGYNPLSFVENQNAVYLPGKDYHLFYDSISGVNEFRVVFNTLFGQNLSLLKDSVVNVKDKK